MIDATSDTKLKSPIALKWTIPAKLLRKLKNQPGEFLTSDSFEAFNIPDVEYFLSIFPNEDDDEKAGETWIYLNLDFSNDMKIEADFTISVESANLCGNLNAIFDASTDNWGETYWKANELFDPEKRLIENGALTIKLDGVLMIKKKKTSSKKKKLMGNCDDLLGLGLWDHEESKNFSIFAEGKEIRVHKNVLSTRSPVFARMLQSGMKEAEEGKVVIEDFTFDIVEKSIKFCYHLSLASDARLQDKLKMLQFFDKYDIQHKSKLEAQLIAILDSSNVCLLTNCALLTNASKLEKRCSEFLLDCLKTQPISDFDLLDKEFALNLMKNAFYHLSSC